MVEGSKVDFCGAAGFSLVFGGSITDFLWAGLMGVVVGFVNRVTSRLEANPVFSTISASFFMALLAYLAAGVNLITNVDAVIIGALMILVPGLLITNSMRDVIYGDTNSGINRIVQVFLTAIASALGTAADDMPRPLVSSGTVMPVNAWARRKASFSSSRIRMEPTSPFPVVSVFSIRHLAF